MARVTGYQKMLAAYQKERAKVQAKTPQLPPAPQLDLAVRTVHTIRDIHVTQESSRAFEYEFDKSGVVSDVEIACVQRGGAPVAAALRYNGLFVQTIPLADGVQRLKSFRHVIRAGDHIEVSARCDGEATIESLTISFRFEALP